MCIPVSFHVESSNKYEHYRPSTIPPSLPFAHPLANNLDLIINKLGSGVAIILSFLLSTFVFNHKFSSDLTFKLTHFTFKHRALQLLHKS